MSKFACRAPYNQSETYTAKERVEAMKKSCSPSSFGPYKNWQTCGEECYIGGKGLDETRAAAAERLQRSVKSKRLRKLISMKVARARETIARERVSKASERMLAEIPRGLSPKSPKKRMAKRSGKLSMKKPSSGRKKSQCVGRYNSNCSSPCTWAAGQKRQYCRIGTNSRRKA